MSSFIEYQNNQIIKERIILSKGNESKTDIKNTQQEYPILSFLKSNKIKNKENLRANSLYNTFKKNSFNYCPIKKFEECDTSLSNISSFDLECQEEKEFNSSFNSLENSFEDNYEKNEEITVNLKIQNDLDEEKYLLELKKEYEEIEKEILNIKN